MHRQAMLGGEGAVGAASAADSVIDPRDGIHSFTARSPPQVAKMSSVGCQDACHTRSLWPSSCAIGMSLAIAADMLSPRNIQADMK